MKTEQEIREIVNRFNQCKGNRKIYEEDRYCTSEKTDYEPCISCIQNMYQDTSTEIAENIGIPLNHLHSYDPLIIIALMWDYGYDVFQEDYQ